MNSPDVRTPNEDIWLNSVCNMCFNTCGIRVHRVNGTIVKIEGDPNNPQNMGRLCAKGNSAIMSLYDPYRVLRPLKRTNPSKGIGVDPKWVEISWEEAIQAVSERLKQVKEREPRGLMVMSFDLNYHGFPILPAFLSAFGTPNWFVGAAAFFCGNVTHPVAYMMQASLETDPDFEYCNYFIMFGNQSGFMSNRDAISQSRKMADARLRGLKVVAVDPMCTNGAAKADEWLPVRPGTDGALALAMLDTLLNELGIYDREFLKKCTNGPYLIGSDGRYLREEGTRKPLVWDTMDSRAKPYDATDIGDYALDGSFAVNGNEVKTAFQLLKEHVRAYSADKVAPITTIAAETVRRVAKEFGEAARIGSTIVIKGKELPYRPAAVDFGKGALAHTNGMATGIAIELLNVVVGAIDVPGGILGLGATDPVGGALGLGDTDQDHAAYDQRAYPKEGPEGLIVSSRPHWPPPLGRPVKEPQTLQVYELFPIAPYSTTLLPLNLINPEEFHVPYNCEALIHFRTNVMMTCADPEVMAESLKRIPFIVSFARDFDETVEFADIVLPEAHEMERLDPFPNRVRQLAGMSPWFWEVRQPVSEAPSGVSHWVSTLQEIADRIGLTSDINMLLNNTFNLTGEYTLDPTKKYSIDEIADRQAKAMFGGEYGLEWFKKNGCLKTPKTVEEAYNRPFFKGRIPIYQEHFLAAGEAVRQVTERLRIPWDTSGYQPLPQWDPCASYEDNINGYDLYAINYKLPFHTFAHTAENPWLDDLCQRHPYAYYVVMAKEVAERKGIGTGDEIWIETSTGEKIRGRVKVSECIHPEVIGIAGAFGHWCENLPIAKNKGPHFNTLLPMRLDRIDMVSTALDACVRVKVYK